MPPHLAGRNYTAYLPDYSVVLASIERDAAITYKDLAAADRVEQMQDQFRVLRAVILPEECTRDPVRYKDEFNTADTAVLGLTMNQRCNWQAQPVAANGSTFNEQVGPNDMFIATFNDSPFCIMVFYLPNPGFALWIYNWQMNASTTLKVGQLGGCIYHNKAAADAISLFRPHGVFLYSGQDKQKYRYMWVDATNGSTLSDGTTARLSTIVVTILTPGTTTANNIFSLNLYRYKNGQPELESSASISITLTDGSPITQSFSLTVSDYYAVTVTAVNNATARTAIAGGFTITSSGRTSCLGHFAVKNLNAHLASLSKSGRINALGIRLTDVAMYQYLNGECAVITCEDGNAWYPLFQTGLEGTTALYDTVADYPGAIIGDLPDGAYTFHKPASKKDYDWKEWVILDPVTEEVLDHWAPLETNNPVKVIAATTMNDNTAGNPSGQGASGYITISVMMEWKTLDDWTPTDKPHETSVAWRDALEKLELFPDATGNAWHWQDFLGGIAKVAKWGAPVWRAAIEAGGSALDKWDPALGSAGRALGNAGLKAAQNLGKGRGKRAAAP